MTDNPKTKKILIASVPDFICAKSYNNSIKELFRTDDKKITALMLAKYLMLTTKEALLMEKDLMDRVRQGLIKQGEYEDD